MARNDLATNLLNNEQDWNSVKDAIEYCGTEVGNDTTNTYGDKIRAFKETIDIGLNAEATIEELETENSELENTKLEYESNFSDINSAIISKGQTPSGGYDTYAEAILNIEGGEVTINLQSKEVEPTTDEQTITPDSGYNGLSSVVVGAVNLQTKQVEPTLSENEVLPDSGFLGLSSVVVSPVSSNIDENIKAENIKDGVVILGIEGSYTGDGSGSGEILLQDIVVRPTTEEQTIEASEGYDGIGTVTVEAVPEVKLQTKTVTPQSYIQGVNPDSGYDGLSYVEVEAVNLQSKSVEPTTSEQTIIADNEYSGLRQVVVGAVTSDIDENIVAENIKSGVTILGVEGTCEATGGGLVITNADYICYQNARTLEDVLPLLKDCTSFNNAFVLAEMTDGAEYVVDVSNAKGVGCFTQAFYNTLIYNGTKGVKLKVIFGEYLGGGKAFNSFNVNGKDNLIDLVLEKSSNDIIYDGLEYLCQGIEKIRSLDFGNMLDNIENCSIAYMFQNMDAPNLDLDLSKLDFSKVKNMNNMYNGATVKSLKFNDLNIINISNIECASLFYNSYIPLGEIVFNLENCRLYQAFAKTDTTSLKINITDTSDADYNDLSKQYAFRGNSKLTEINTDLDYWEIYGDTIYMFQNNNILTKVPKIKKYVSSNNYGSLNTMYESCTLLEEIYIEMIHTENHTATGYTMQGAFYNDTALKKIAGNLDMSYVNNVNSMFSNCTSLVTIETTGSFGGKSTTNTLTLDLSASAVFDATSFINSLATNESGKTRNIKLHADVLAGLTDETKALATTKNYILQ